MQFSVIHNLHVSVELQNIRRPEETACFHSRFAFTVCQRWMDYSHTVCMYVCTVIIILVSSITLPLPSLNSYLFSSDPPVLLSDE